MIVKLPWRVAACCSLLLSCAATDDPPKDSTDTAGTSQTANSPADSDIRPPLSQPPGQPEMKATTMPDKLPARTGPNRLIHEKSPYLLQHAHNPVDWYPWGEEAFERARRENKPIFLSIGYSTCHWCHVMAHESFEDEAVAAVLNENFIAIKLDREERPDIDRIYMSFVQTTTGRGGWPLNVFLTPELKPFFGGTYFPPKRAGNRPGFIELLNLVTRKWNTENANLLQSADQIVDQLRKQAQLHDTSPANGAKLSGTSFAAAYEQLEGRFDEVHAGFGNAPKFPRPPELLFLHRQFARTGNTKALDMSVRTLDAMARGGIHDQLAGGFHRYSTDAFWREPHFEKMLYDQAQLVVAYLEAYQLTGKVRFADYARMTLDYVARDMRDPAGGFYSAEDADSAPDRDDPHHKIEGAFYVWSHAELEALLAPELMQLVVEYYGVTPGGNLRTGELRGKNALYIDAPLAEIADSLGIEIAEAQSRLARLHEQLLQERATRLRPHLDDKVITSWNGLMITAFARAAQVLHNDHYQQVAVKAATFVLDELWDEKTEQLQRRWRLGEAGIPGFNVDYAYLVQGMLDLYETTFDYRWLQWARRLTDRQIALFNDFDAGAFFEVTDEDATVLIRSKERYDGAQPTSNSITALNLLRLGEMTDSQTYRALAQQLLQFYAAALQTSPLALPSMLIALDWKLGTTQQIIIAGDVGKSDTQKLLDVVHEKFLPHKILLLADGKEAQKRLAADLPFIATMAPQGGSATAFVCQDYACQLPVTDAQALARQLNPTP